MLRQNMKALLATLFFLVEAIFLIVGTAMAANGKGFTVLLIGIAVLGAMFVKLGCLDNAPKH